MIFVSAWIMGAIVHRSSRVGAEFLLLVFTRWYRIKILIITVPRLTEYRYTSASAVRNWSGRAGYGIAMSLTVLKPTTAGLVFRTLTWNHLVFGSFFYMFDLYSRNTGGLEMEHSSTSYLLWHSFCIHSVQDMREWRISYVSSGSCLFCLYNFWPTLSL